MAHQVGRALEGWSGRGNEISAHLQRHDVREGRLAESWRTAQQQVVERLMALSGGFQRDCQSPALLVLADEFVQVAWP